MVIRMCYFTENGKQIASLLQKLEREFLWEVRDEESSMQEWVRDSFEKRLPILFIGACGIAVRMIAPYVTDKLTDSPVLVMDEKGQFVIPVLSGHVGGANELARLVAKLLEATPVITTATDLSLRFAVDVFAVQNSLHIVNRDGIAKVSRKLLAQETVKLAMEHDIERCEGELPDGLELVSEDADEVDIRIVRGESNKKQLLLLETKEYVAGMGCRKGKSFESLHAFLRKYCPVCVDTKLGALASIDQKAEEKGLVMLAQFYHIPFETFSADRLNAVPGNFAESKFVQEQVGVSGVCERAAMCLAGEDGRLILSKVAEDGMTLAIARRVPRIETWETMKRK